MASLACKLHEAHYQRDASGNKRRENDHPNRHRKPNWIGCGEECHSFVWRVELGERFGSGDGERNTLLTRQIAFEPLPASVLFGLGGLVSIARSSQCADLEDVIDWMAGKNGCSCNVIGGVDEKTQNSVGNLCSGETFGI